MKSEISLQRASQPSDATTLFMLFADGAAGWRARGTTFRG